MHIVKVNRLVLNLPRITHRTNVCQRWITHSAADKNGLFSVGTKLHGYTVRQVVPVSELSLTAIHLDHHTGAQHLHISRQDNNNVFGVALRTTPVESTGTPHILEHLSLCGSSKYPVRDPFFKMLTRSLSTFMNAFTASDWTMYPFSTQNRQDYQNLMSVYLDAVFFPLLRHLDFCQEGWRLEHEDPNDPSSPIVFKGVVYNEMKGAFSNPQSLFAEKTQNLLFPSHTYGVVSGGDPEFIPDLTWQHLKDFHTFHYHPSNSRFYTYGNFPLEGHLQYINDILSHFQPVNVDTSVPLEPRWDTPKETVIRCAPDPMSPDPDKQTTVAVSYMLADITNVNEACALSILGSLLVDGEKSPFYQSLLESNLGSDYAPTTGFNGYMRQSMFSVGLQRVGTNDIDKVKDIIEETFDRVIAEGFERERIDAILHKIEIGLKHQSEKFGLNLAMSLLPSWNHGGNPIELLQINKQVSWFKEQLSSNPKYLEDLVVKYFKNNRHRLTLIMIPDDKFNEISKHLEHEKLTKKLSSLAPSEKENIYKIGNELMELQSRQEDLTCLPSLKVSDIDRDVERVLITNKSSGHTGQVPLDLCSQPTNDVTYFRAVSSIANLPQQLKPFVPLFCNIVTRMGAGTMDYKDLSHQMELKTGDMAARPHVTEHHCDSNKFEQSVLFTSHCLNRNVADMLHLWTEIFNRLSLADMNRLQTLIYMVASETSSGLSDMGHRYAMSHAASSLNACSATQEFMQGMTQVGLMKSLAESADLGTVVGHLKDIAAHVLLADNLRCFVTSTEDNIDKVDQVTDRFLKSLPSGTAVSKDRSFYIQDDSFVAKSSCTHYELPFHVNFIARSLPTVPYSHPHFACLRILAKILSSRYLHKEIREKGGAYGGGAVGDRNGLFQFYSYRDPNLQKTLETFESCTAWAADGKFNDKDIDEAKLAVFSQVDSPVPPGSKGMRQFLYGLSDDAFQNHRQQLLDVNKDGLVDVARRYLTDKNRCSSVTVLGPSSTMTTETAVWTIHRQE